eukprot:1177473-Prorocentrum_minimum.AAC.1
MFTNRRGAHQIGSRLTSSLVRRRYREACQAAHEATSQQLRQLAARIEGGLDGGGGYMDEIVTASVFSLAARTFVDHVCEAGRRGWTLPTLLTIPPQVAVREYG